MLSLVLGHPLGSSNTFGVNKGRRLYWVSLWLHISTLELADPPMVLTGWRAERMTCGFMQNKRALILASVVGGHKATSAAFVSFNLYIQKDALRNYCNN